jgi:uncharacterized protein (DUF1330 family)
MPLLLRFEIPCSIFEISNIFGYVLRRNGQMSQVHPSVGQMNDFVKLPDTGSFVMINLLKFRETAATGKESGEAAYTRYMINVAPLLEKAGGRLLWMGSVKQVFIGADTDQWDRAMLVEYPSKQAFLDMISAPEYQEVHKDREAGLETSALLMTKTEAGII